MDDAVVGCVIIETNFFHELSIVVIYGHGLDSREFIVFCEYNFPLTEMDLVQLLAACIHIMSGNRPVGHSSVRNDIPIVIALVSVCDVLHPADNDRILHTLVRHIVCHRDVGFPVGINPFLAAKSISYDYIIIVYFYPILCLALIIDE